MRYDLLLSLLVASCATANTCGAIIYGYCHLEGQSNDCLTRVEIDGSVLHPAVNTDADGYYGWLAIAPGWHTFDYSHPGYFSETHEVYVPVFGGELPNVTLESKALCDPPGWQYYTYYLEGTDMKFPFDDGKHGSTSEYPIEWWYINFHITDEGHNEYGGFVAFFKPPAIGLPSLVLMSVIDLDTGIFYSDAKIQELFTAHDQYLDLAAGLPPCDRWFNRECDGFYRPFEYHLYASGLDNGILWIDMNMAALKPPMPVGGEGLVEFDDSGWSYYYSYPQVDILGKLHLPGFPALGKDMEGHGWIDHQWADFPVGDISWEWLSIQLDDNREIMVANVWAGEEMLGSFSGGLNLYGGGCGLQILEDYNMTPIDWWTDDVTDKTFAIGWRITEPSEQIDIEVAAEFEEQIMRIGENEIFKPCFWEGACTVSGTIDGEAVAGTAYAEVTHLTGDLCPCDINNDGAVDIDDLFCVLSAWGPCDDCPEDINDDGMVDINDIFSVLGAWGPC